MTTYYINAVSGNDTTGDGTIGLPYATVNKAWGLSASATNTILLAQGHCFDTDNNVHLYGTSGTPYSNKTIGSYQADNSPNAEAPIIECGFFEPSSATDWTDVGAASPSGRIWKKQLINSGTHYRVFANSSKTGSLTTQRTIGNALRRAASTAINNNTCTEANLQSTLTATDPWYCGTSTNLSYTLYMWTPDAGTQPSAYYSGLYVVGGVNTASSPKLGVADGMDVIAAQNITISGVQFRGGGLSIRANAAMARDTLNILIEDCSMTHGNYGGKVYLVTQTDSGYRNKNVRFERCVFNSYTCEAEQEPTETYNWQSGVSDGFVLMNGSVGCHIRGCSTYNAMHAAYMMTVTGVGYAFATGCSVTNCYAFCDTWGTYSNPGSGLGLKCLWARNVFDGMSSPLYFNGENDVFSNVFKNMKYSTRKPNTSGFVLSTNGYVLDMANGLSGTERYAVMPVVKVRMYNNSCISGEYHTAIKFDNSDDLIGGYSVLWTLNAIEVRNNVFAGTLVAEEGNSGGVYSDPRFCVINANGTDTYENQIVTNNVAQVGRTGQNEVLFNNDGAWVEYTLNGLTGFSGNIEATPNMSSTGLPLESGNLYGGGVFSAKINDSAGHPFWNPPSIGAFEAVRPRTIKTEAAAL